MLTKSCPFDLGFHFLRSTLCALAVVCLLCLAADPEHAAVHVTSLIRDIYLELSFGQTVPLDWNPGVPAYSLAVPRDAPLAAVRVATSRGETAQEEAPLHRPGALLLRLPLLQVSLPLVPNQPSEYLEMGTEAATLLQLAVAGREYTIHVIRSLVAYNGQGLRPDPARQHPPPGTLTGIQLTDSTGHPARMTWFMPRCSFYRASVPEDACDVRLVATPNDPDAELEWRRNGLEWDFLVPGFTSMPTNVSPYGWTLLEIRVHSRVASATGMAAGPLTYQIVVTKELVCHPKCRGCSGAGPEDCLSCDPPLILHNGKCLFTSCQASGRYFDFDSEKCLDCHPSCAECEDGSAQGCTLCQPLRFLLVRSELDVAGQCLTTCPLGYSVQPANQHCRRTSHGVNGEKLLLRLTLRIGPEDFADSPELLRTVLLMASKTLVVSPQDVRFRRWEKDPLGKGIMYFIEVENPYLDLQQVQDIEIDNWFASLPVPVDSVRALTVENTGVMLAPPQPAPVLQTWMWGLIGAGICTLAIGCPVYHLYFLRRYYEKSPYRPSTAKEEDFVQEVLDSAPDMSIKAMAARKPVGQVRGSGPSPQ